MNAIPALLLIAIMGASHGCRINPPIKTEKTKPEEQIAHIKLPEGFSISVYAPGIKNARAMALGADGTVYAGSRKEGKLYSIKDKNGDGKTDKITVLATGLHMPTGVAYHKGDLYVSEVSRILIYRKIDTHTEKAPEPEVLSYSFPSDEHHGWKFIDFGPDGKLYVPVGAPCNVCEKEDQRYSSIMRINTDGTEPEVFAHGVRNSVGFAWHPETKELWFTDNGRDWLGDDIPPCELNHAPAAGLHFGFPYCHGGTILDPEYGKDKKCVDYRAPAQNLGPHTAPLGMMFYTGSRFPAKYRNGVFIAEHGSWNRTAPIGYRITFVALEENKALSYEPFAEGWLQQDGTRWGRPVDLLELPDGSVLVSDDYGDCIYRIHYSGK
jgi:glucose/arabinose dehydrogenase